MRTARLLRPALTALILAALAVPGAVAPAGAAPGPSVGTSPSAPARYLVQYTPGTDIAAEARSLRSKGVGSSAVKVGRTFSAAVRGAVVTATPAQASILKRSARVAAVELDAPVSLAETQQPVTWGLDRVDQRALPLSGSYSYTASGAAVAAYVIDTGVLASHTDFGGRVAPGWTAVADGRGTTDCNGHGTHVSGTIAGARYGVAKAATIIPVRVLDCAGSGYNSDVVAGLDWVAAHHTAGTPAVANMSIGGAASSIVDAAVQAIIDDGVTAVVAAGNSATDACKSSPARAPQALTVAASDSSDRQASFSNSGSCVDLYAPGVGITSDWYTSTTATATISGTSMAAPHTAGAAALLLSQSPALNPAQVSAAITTTATAGVVSAASAGTPNRLLYTGAEAATIDQVPSILSRSPGINARFVGRTANVSATFSEPVEGIGGSTFTLRNAKTGALVGAAVYQNGTTDQWILNPSASLASRTKYTVTITGGSNAVRDLTGNPLQTAIWSFTTGRR